MCICLSPCRASTPAAEHKSSSLCNPSSCRAVPPKIRVVARPQKLRHFFPTALDSANGMPRSPIGETHFQSQLTHAFPRQADASGNFGMGDAIALQHGADQFSLSVSNGKRVPLKTAVIKLKAAGLAVTYGVWHSSIHLSAT